MTDSDPAPTGADSDLVSSLRAARANVAAPAMVLFTAPAPTIADVDAREERARRLADAAGLLPWPDWAAVRHGKGLGAHVLSIISELGETGRANGVIVCALSPIDASLVAHAGAVAADAGLDVAVVGAEGIR